MTIVRTMTRLSFACFLLVARAVAAQAAPQPPVVGIIVEVEDRAALIQPAPGASLAAGEFLAIDGMPGVTAQVRVVGQRGVVVWIGGHRAVEVGTEVRRLLPERDGSPHPSSSAAGTAPRDHAGRPATLAAPLPPGDGLRLRAFGGPRLPHLGVVGEAELVARRGAVEVAVAMLPSAYGSAHSVDGSMRMSSTAQIHLAAGFAYAPRFGAFGLAGALHTNRDAGTTSVDPGRHIAGGLVPRIVLGASGGVHATLDLGFDLDRARLGHVYHWNLGFYFPAAFRTLLGLRALGYTGRWGYNQIDFTLRQRISSGRDGPGVYLLSSVSILGCYGYRTNASGAPPERSTESAVALRVGVEVRTERGRTTR